MADERKGGHEKGNIRKERKGMTKSGTSGRNGNFLGRTMDDY